MGAGFLLVLLLLLLLGSLRPSHSERDPLSDDEARVAAVVAVVDRATGRAATLGLLAATTGKESVVFTLLESEPDPSSDEGRGGVE